MSSLIIIRRKRSLLLLPVLVLFLSVSDAFGQAQREVPPVKPNPVQTSQLNPRGADVVEPASVYLVRGDSGESVDSLYLGLAKIPDPRREEEGAFTNVDLDTGTLIRLGGAWIYGDNGRRRIVSFRLGSGDRLAFRMGPHDVVESTQGVAPHAQIPGVETTFELDALYGSALPAAQDDGISDVSSRPRIALLKMRSTFPRGEAVDLAVILAPDALPAARILQPIAVVHRDTVILQPKYEVVINRTYPVVRSLAALVSVETGYGGSFSRTAVPSTIIPQFASGGRAGDLYFDTYLQLRQHQNRWTLRAVGTSAVTATDITEVRHHQIALFGLARFESGDRRFILAQMNAELRDKPYQEFDLNSADYSGSMFVGYGVRRLAPNGIETRRAQVILGMRLGENRPIEFMETRLRSRGIGPTIGIGLEAASIRRSGVELRIGTDVYAYRIDGRGHRDQGFAEKGIFAHADAEVGYELRGAYVYGALNLLTTARGADYPNGGRFTERKAALAPGLGIQMRL